MRKLNAGMFFLTCFTVLFVCSTAFSKVDLVTLPERDSVQLTIYNSADLTLARDRRPLMLTEGANRLQFAWSGTLIDPTSLEMMSRAHADQIYVQEITYPPRVKNVGIWNIHSDITGEVPMEITFFTSGLNWDAYYIATLSEDESAMSLDGYVKVTNNSGEDYENARVRLVVGEINLLDKIADLAQRPDPYSTEPEVRRKAELLGRARRELFAADSQMHVAAHAPKEIVKEGLSEYFLYTIEGKETIPDGWSKRLKSFDADQVSVVNLYKFEKERYDNETIRFVSFKNDEEHNLGETPLPDGTINVFRRSQNGDGLHYLGADQTRYIPVDQEVELNLGPSREVSVEPVLMDFAKENFMYDTERRIEGFDEVRTYEIEVRNLSERPAKIEIRRNLDTGYWQIEETVGPARPETIDERSFQYELQLAPRSTETLVYTIRLYRGERQGQK